MMGDRDDDLRDCDGDKVPDVGVLAAIDFNRDAIRLLLHTCDILTFSWTLGPPLHRCQPPGKLDCAGSDGVHHMRFQQTKPLS